MKQKYIQGFYLSNADSDLYNLTISNSDLSEKISAGNNVGGVSSTDSVSDSACQELLAFAGMAIIGLDKHFLEKDFIRGLQSRVENKDFQGATS